MPPPEKLTWEKASKAFTLAEVLITLGIIGVVAALTIPTLVSKYQKLVIENKLKVAYSTISNALQIVNYQNDFAFAPNELSNNTGSINGWDFSVSELVFNEYFRPNIKVIKEYSEIDRFEVCNINRENCYKNPSYKCYILPNNTGLCFAINYQTGKIAIQIVVSPQKEKLIAGKDVFGFLVDRNITQNNYNMNIAKNSICNNTEEYIKNACINSNVFTDDSDREFWCTCLIFNNGWQIPKDYPIKF